MVGQKRQHPDTTSGQVDMVSMYMYVLSTSAVYPAHVRGLRLFKPVHISVKPEQKAAEDDQEQGVCLCF